MSIREAQMSQNSSQKQKSYNSTKPVKEKGEGKKKQFPLNVIFEDLK